MDNRKKYKTDTGAGYPLIGKFVHHHVLKNKIPKAELSRSLGILPTGLNDYFKRDSLQFAILWKLSKTMQHNLIAQLGEHLAIPYETKREKALAKELQEHKALIHDLETKLSVYEKITGAK